MRNSSTGMRTRTIQRDLDGGRVASAVMDMGSVACSLRRKFHSRRRPSSDCEEALDSRAAPGRFRIKFRLDLPSKAGILVIDLAAGVD